MSDPKLDEIKARLSTSYQGYRSLHAMLVDVRYLLTLLDRPVSQDSGRVNCGTPPDRIWVHPWREIPYYSPTDQPDYIEYVRAVVSEDDERAIRGLFRKYLKGDHPEQLINSLASDRASVRDAARLEKWDAEVKINELEWKVRELTEHDFGNLNNAHPCSRCGVTTCDDHAGYDCTAWLQRRLQEEADAVRLAERDRIREKVKALTVKSWCGVQYVHLFEVVEVIDGQPVLDTEEVKD